jgi:hypothetical protein
MNAHITAERVRELFSYDPETGVFRHLRTPWNRRVQAGDAAGFASGPYWTIYADGRTYKAHRLAWLYVHGECPTGEVDHINGDKLDNRIINLRPVTRSENQQNVYAPRKDNRFGLRGVSKVAGRSKRYSARIWKDGKRITLGHFLTPEEAAECYANAKAELHITGAL